VSGAVRLFTTVTLKMAGERRATADVLFTDRSDRDREAFAPRAFPAATVPIHREHESLLGGNAPPFGVARIAEVSGKYVADLSFLPTPRGDEEYVTAKALDAAGVVQPVSVSFERLETADVPPALKAVGVRRYVTSGRFIEISFVGIGAVPNAQVTAVKCVACAAKESRELSSPSLAEARALRARVERMLRAPELSVPTVGALARRVERIDAQVGTFICATSEPSPWTRATSRRWANAVEGVLGLSPVTFRWAVTDAKALGQFDPREPDTIFLNSTIQPEAIGVTVVHEQVHRFRVRCGLPDGEAVVERDTALLMERLT
jgi:hypothetical protein